MIQSDSRRGFLRNLGTFGVGNVTGFLLSGCATPSNLTATIKPQEKRNGVPATIMTESGIRISHIQTGFVAVKRAHWKYGGPDGTGILAIMTGRRFIDWVPISSWLIEHPEGNILVDTGETHRAARDEGYFDCDPGTGFFYRSNLRFDVGKKEETLPQLTSMGVNADSIRWIVQTHLHSDHMGGLKDFPRSEVYVSAADYPSSMGVLSCRLPQLLSLKFPNFMPSPLEGFPQAYALTRAKDIWIVPTPGHSDGHQSVLLRDGEKSFLFAGDAVFTQEHLLSNVRQGIASRPREYRSSLDAIKRYVGSHPTVFLPTHDPMSRLRLLKQSVVLI